MTKGGTVTATATIQAIDHATRSVTLRNDKGEEDTFVAGPEVQRFNELKVGDTIRLTYHESLVFQLRKAGAPSRESGDALAAGRLKSMPGGAVAVQQTRTVTVKAVDPDRAVDHGRNRGWPHDYPEGRGPEEHRRHQARRSHRHHVHAGGRNQRGTRQVVADALMTRLRPQAAPVWDAGAAGTADGGRPEVKPGPGDSDRPGARLDCGIAEDVRQNWLVVRPAALSPPARPPCPRLP